MIPRYFLARDAEAHWYLVPVIIRQQWDEWRGLDEDDEAPWTVPEGAIMLGFAPFLVEFENPTVDARHTAARGANMKKTTIRKVRLNPDARNTENLTLEEKLAVMNKRKAVRQAAKPVVAIVATTVAENATVAVNDLETRVLREVSHYEDGALESFVSHGVVEALLEDEPCVAEGAQRLFVNGVIQGLVFARKLNRTVSGEGNRRRYYLHLTDKGRVALKETA